MGVIQRVKDDGAWQRVALVNTNLTGASLAHSIDVVEPKHVIVAAELVPALLTARDRLKTAAKIWTHGADGEFPRIDLAVADCSAENLAGGERIALTIE